MRKFVYKPEKSFAGKTVKAFLQHEGYSAEIIKGLKKGGLLVNGAEAHTVRLLNENDIVETFLEDELPDIEPCLNPEIKLVYSDADVAVMYKPPYVPTHQSIGHYNDTLANHFAALFPYSRFRAVTRLDKNTSGLCVAALNRLSAAILCKNRPQKLYYAAVKGSVPLSGTINAPIERENDSVIKRVVNPKGKPAVTHYKTIRQSGDNKLLEISLETGRTHQIRVHMSHIGFPLLGDEMYGGDTSEIGRQALHCGYVELSHPITREKLSFTCPLPEDMERLFL
ncbi:MAG: RluA family pseudouridine synthase [Bacteroides sp.]|nr:RluA family pseudouridine synthase [Bacteroides sp.]